MFTTLIYQPFLNILIGIYWLLGFIMDQPDMGVAVIILTILIRILLMPISIASDRSEHERRQIAHDIAEVEKVYAADPIRRKEEKKRIMRVNVRVLIAEMINLSIQVAIALMLWQMFETGLPGEDWHLLYSFMPDVPHPYNLSFLGMYDLSHTSFTLNFLQSVAILAFEVISVVDSPYPVTRDQVVRMQFLLPIVSFLIFMYLPAGKKLFVITTLIFSMVFTIVKMIWRRFSYYQEKWDQQSGNSAQDSEKILVETKT